MTDLWRAFVALSHVTAFLILGSSALAQPIPQDGHPDVLVGAGPGSGLARLLSGVDGSELASGYPFGGFTGAVRVATGDFNGDGTPDLVTATGPGDGRVHVFDGLDAAEIARFTPFGPDFRGGVYVATGDIDGDGRADLLVGGGTGSGLVRVYSGATRVELASGAPFGPLYAGGVTVATGDVNGDGQVDVIAGTAIGGLVRVFNGASVPEIASGFPYGATFMGGVFVAAGDVDGDGRAEVITGARSASGVVRVFDSTGSILASFEPFGASDGVTVAAGDLTGDGRADVVTGAGAGVAPRVRAFRGLDGLELLNGLAFDPGFRGGVFVATTAEATAGRFTSPNAATFEVGDAGTFAVTTAGRVAPIAVTGALPSGVTFTDHGDGTATLAGTPAAGTSGTFALTFRGGTGGSVTQSFTLTVEEAPAITSATTTTFLVATAGTFTVAATGFPNPAITSTGALPTGVTFTDNGDGTATLAGTPGAGTGGTYALTLTAANGIGTPATQSFSLVVQQAPAFTSAAATTFIVASPGTFAITTSGLPAVTTIARAGVLPAGVTFVDNGNGTATIAGTPAAGTGGAYAITLTADNGVGTNATQNFTLSVHEAPAITSATTVTFPIGAPGTFTVTTTAFPVATLTRGGVGLPAGVAFVDNGDGTGTLAGTPAAGSGGAYAITFTAANGIGAGAVQNFTLIVDSSPAFTSAAGTTFAVAAPGTFTVTTTGLPTPALTSTGALPAGVTFADNGNGTGTLSGAPAAGTSGSHAITFTASNGVHAPVVQNFTLTVRQAPAITSAAATTFVTGNAGTFTMTTTGFPAPGITIGGAALPAGVTWVDNGNGTGTLAGTPAAGTDGTYAISFTAANGIGANAVQSFTLTVNQAPAFTSAASTGFQVAVAGTFTVTTSGSPAITTITPGGVALPGGVTYTDNANGTATLSGTPAAGTGGSYAVTFTINNGVGGNVVQNFTLNVNQAPTITSGNADTFTVGTADSFAVTAGGLPTPILSVAGTLPTGVTFTPGTGALAGTPTQTGTFNTIQFTAANGIVPNAVQSFTLNVVCPAITVNPAAMPVGLFQVAYAGGAGVTFTQTGSTGSTITWSATGLPAGLAIGPTTGVVSGTPTNTVLNGAVSVTATDNFGCTSTRNTTIIVRPTTDNESYTGGVGGTQFVVAASGPATPHVFVNDNVKTGDNGPGTLTITFPATSTNGVIVEGATDGTFTYTPNLNFAGPTDSFSYVLTDGNGVTNTGLVTINLSNLVWYVNSAGANGDGRSHNPFNTLASVATASASGSTIYVHTGGATTPGNLAMDANQVLFGQGAVFTLNSLTIPAAARPTLTGTVTLASNTGVTAVNFSGASPALTASATSFSQPVAIDQVNVSGGTSALSLTNVTATATGAITISNASFTNTSGAEVLMSGGNIPVTLAATATISSNAGRSIDIQNRTGGTVSFAGPITDTGTGVLLNANTGTTIAFTGGLALSTGGNAAFTATGGGTVIATQNNTTIVNTITTTTGLALNVANTTIGVSGLTFRSIAANGGANGIVLNTTGASGGLTVTGNGGTCTPAAPTCTGGRIQNSTGGDDSTATPVGTGIVLNNTAAVSLTRMRLDNHSNYAIRGTSVNGFTFDNGLVDGANGTNVATPFNDGSFVFFGVTGSSPGMTGTSAITNSTIQGGHQRNIAIDNSVGTLNLSVSGNTIRRTSDAAGDDGFFLEADTSANVTLAITNNTFARHGGDHINVTMVNNAVVNATITGNTLHGNYTGTPEGNHPIGLSQGIFLFGAAFNGTVTYNISNNGTVAVPFRGSRQGGAIHVNKGSGTGTFSGRIENNVIGDPAVIGSGSSEAFGIIVGARGAGGLHTTLINNNQIRQYFDRGIVLEAGEGSAALNANVTNNTVTSFADAINSLHGIHSDNGILAADNNAVCLNFSGNSVATAGNEPQGGADIRLRRGSNTTVAIPGIAGATNANAQTRLSALNPTATTVTVTGNGFTNAASCPLP